jgi:hypothetical protein
VSEDQVIQFLRTRAHVDPVPDLVPRVMAAIEEAPSVRSPVAAFLPAFAIAGVVAIVVALALILGQGPNVGPNPTESLDAVPSPATVDELRGAVESGLDVLREAPGVEGSATSSVLGELSAATWFSWRPNGDQIVISRTDVDVSETAWWLNPEAEPPARGENIAQMIQVLVGDEYFMADDGTWVVEARNEAPTILALATGTLDGDALSIEGMFSNPPGGDATVVRHRDGGTTWSLTAPYRDGTATTDWEFAPNGALVSWSSELIGVTPTPEDAQFTTLGQVTFAPDSDAGAIEAPDPAEPPDPAALGLPSGFPLEPTAVP